MRATELRPVAIHASGMITGVGLSAPSTCAAIRCAIDRFADTRFVDKGGEWIVGSSVPLAGRWQGRRKLVKLLAAAIAECLGQAVDLTPSAIPLLLCVAERSRPGRLGGLETELVAEVEAELGASFHRRSMVIARGRVAGAVGVAMARRLVYEERIPFCLVAGVDSLLHAPTIAAYDAGDRLLTSKNSDGFIPGEAGAAVLIGAPRSSTEPELLCLGVGEGVERATIDSEQPLRADGLVQAIRAAGADAGRGIDATDFRLTDLNCEHYGFKEAAFALQRTLRVHKEEYPIWHPADCIGEVGAAVGPCVLGVALAAARRGYAPGPGALCHFGNDDGERVALILAYESLSSARQRQRG
jgi:3-oxoacyl-[acyl-carrier-protein] synthase I